MKCIWLQGDGPGALQLYHASALCPRHPGFALSPFNYIMKPQICHDVYILKTVKIRYNDDNCER